MKRGRLVLGNGLVMEGVSVGVDGTSVGELVFNISMSGYQEMMTDPSYCGQVVMLTTPHIGNVGVNADDNESTKCWCAGLIVRSFAKRAANWRSEQSLAAYLQEQNIVALSEIDTRHLTHVLRDEGAQSVCITTQLSVEDALLKAKAFEGLKGKDLAQVVSTPHSYEWRTSSKAWARSQVDKPFCHVVAYDFGVKFNSLKLLVDAGASVTVVNAKTPVEQVLAMKPDGVFLSNGPGDPSACSYAIETAKRLIEAKVPLFGICLGFQLMALALGAQTEKMKFGHHGSNHPVIDLNSQEIYITSQNHGFMVSDNTLPDNVTITHRSLFDKTIQGIAFDNAIGFQGHPEGSPGPHDALPLFSQFMTIIKNQQEGSAV
jgi:carbamoyl-phosphate synthase small subunit